MGKEHLAIVGAGLCGTLLAVRLAQRGFKVDLFERRPDLRKQDLGAGRSINLALSDRGLQALEMVGAEDKVRSLMLPMKGRLLHDMKGETKMSFYSGRDGHHINSISRSGLNALLLDMAESYADVTLYFNHSCISFEPEEAQLHFRDSRGETIRKQYDRVLVLMVPDQLFVKVSWLDRIKCDLTLSSLFSLTDTKNYRFRRPRMEVSLFHRKDFTFGRGMNL